VDHLARIFEDGLLDAVDLTLVPYSNTRVHSGGEKRDHLPSDRRALCVSLQ
jgi:hypothetical protein